MLKSTHSFIHKVGTKVGIPKAQIDAFLKIDNLVEFKINNKYAAYRAQHNNTLGPYKGGIRFHQDVSADEVKSLATLMSLKTAAAGLPLGGGKGGVAVNPKKLDEKQIEQIAREYVRGVKDAIGPDVDVPAPDVNTTPQIMDWMVDEYSQLSGDTTKASFTGKSIGNGGSKGRGTATGRGGVITLVAILKSMELEGQNLTYAVQGFGNAGTNFAEAAKELLPNLELAAVTDSSGGVSSGFGLNVDDLIKFKRGGGKLSAYNSDESVKIDNEQLIEEEVDILVLAALGGAVNTKNAKNVKAKIIVELANGPVTDTASKTLEKNDVIIVPDILANAGGVTVSYFEWQQNKSGTYLSLPQINKKLATHLETATKDILKIAKKENLNLREAAIAKALRVIIKASK